MRRAAAALATLALVACKRDSPSSKKIDEPQALALPAKPVPAGSLVQPPFYTDYAVLVPDGVDPELGAAAVRDAAKARGLDVRAFDQRAGAARGVVVGVDTVDGAGVELESLEDEVDELDDAELARLRAVKRVVHIGTFDDRDAPGTIRVGAALARAAAKATGGWVRDGSLDRIYTLAQFDEEVPDDVAMTALSVLGATYEPLDDGTFEVGTLGLHRMGLPELVLRGVPEAALLKGAVVIDAAAQELLERGGLATEGELAVDLARFTAPPWPERAARARERGGTGKVTLIATWSAPPSALDARREIELALPGTGAPAERLYAAADALTGSEGEQLHWHPKDDPELLAVRDRAQQELAALERHFADGVPDGEELIVKAPFATDDGGVEWMWVDVERWRGPTMTGTLANHPQLIAALREGARVEVKVVELADYVHTRADGTRAGGASIEILQRKQRAAQ